MSYDRAIESQDTRAANSAASRNAVGRSGIPNGLLQALMLNKYGS